LAVAGARGAVTKITTVFWDIGGVLLTNGWDHMTRQKAAERFGLEWEEFETRHQAVEKAHDLGWITLTEYLNHAIFYKPRSFSFAELSAYLFAQSQPHPDALAVLAEIAGSQRYLLAALNNEPFELNQYRIDRFGLRRYFSAFFSSCFLGLAKPDPEIYRRALQITQRSPAECLFIDDRLVNIEAAVRLGIQTLHHQGDTAALHRELQALLKG
jgi:putative hydrolase of the HAD superfamily